MFAMATLFTLVAAPVPPSRRDTVKTFVEAVFALISALIGGWFVAPAIVRAYNIVAPESITLIGLLVGLTFWQSVPWVVKASEKIGTFVLERAVGIKVDK